MTPSVSPSVPRTVLIADDSAFLRAALGGALQAETQLVVVEAKNGQEALEILAGDPDVRAVVLDVNMPILGGVEVLEELDRAVRPLFVVAIGGQGDDELLERCRVLGADEVLTKPLDVETLCVLLRKAIERR